MIRVELAEYKGYWVLRWRDPQTGKRPGRGAGRVDKVSRRKAESARARLEHELNAGLVAPGKPPTLEQWVQTYRGIRRVAPRTAKMQDSYLDLRIVPGLGAQTRISKIRELDALRWVKSLEGTMEPISVAGCLRVARTVFAAAARAHRFTDPFAHVRYAFTYPAPHVPTLSDADIQALVDACPTPAWKALVGLCAWGGLRLGEAMILTWDGVQFDRNRIVVPQPKTARSKGRERVCLLEPHLARVLAEVRDAQEGPAVVAKGLRNLHRDFEVIRRRAGLTAWPKPFHGLRKWRSSSWKQTYPAAVVDAWLGHGAEVARKAYFAVPEHFYGGQGLPEIEQLRRENARLLAQIERTESGQNPVA